MFNGLAILAAFASNDDPYQGPRDITTPECMVKEDQTLVHSVVIVQDHKHKNTQCFQSFHCTSGFQSCSAVRKTFSTYLRKKHYYLCFRPTTFSQSCLEFLPSSTCSCSAQARERRIGRKWWDNCRWSLLHDWHCVPVCGCFILWMWNALLSQALTSVMSLMRLMGSKHISSVRVKMMTTLRIGLKYREDYPLLCCQSVTHTHTLHYIQYIFILIFKWFTTTEIILLLSYLH